MAALGAPTFRGRAAERARLARLLEALRSGRSAALVVRGEAGVGKTALLDDWTREAYGVRVSRIAGVEAEAELPFAALHQLCAPLLDRLSALPEPQQAALRVALGVAPGATPDRFLVALAALTLLSEAAAEQPLLCVVDDAQWLDDASAQVLGFVARRLEAESVALVFAIRSPLEQHALTGLPELELEGLPDEDARELLATVFPGRIDERVRDRVLAETRGNPLALLELPRGLPSAHLAGGFGLPDPAPLSGRIEKSFLRRLAELPAETRRLLLVAAAEPLGDPTLLWGAAERLGIGALALEPAVRAGLVEVGARVCFRHPLVRSAVYGASSVPDRRRAHEALADETDADVDPDRRAWHRAQAAAGPDELVAAELEESAGRAQARGGLAAAAAFWQRAADLTVDPARRAERALAAAEAHLQAGAFDAALGMLARARAEALDDLGRARADLLQAAAAYAEHRDGDAVPPLLRAARRLESLDVRLARDTYLDAWGAALFAAGLAGGDPLAEVSRAVVAARAPASPRRASDELLDGFALVSLQGRAAAAPVLQRATRAFAADGEASAAEVLRWGWLATAGAVVVWDFDTCLAVATRGADLARRSGALEVLAVSVNVLSQAVALRGDLDAAGQLVAEADAVRAATGTRVAPYGALVLAALRGRARDAFALIDAAIADASAGGQGNAVQYARWARAVVLNALGRHDEALAAATEAASDLPELFVATWSLSELIEAAERAGDRDAAQHALARLGEHAHGSDADWARGMHARGSALLAGGATAEALYREAIDRLGRTQLAPELARSRLLYGEWLRRAGRDAEARGVLRDAHTAFATIGAEAFAERAAGALGAVGEYVGAPDATRDQLTAQEQHIARLARDGLTNAEIGAKLVLSPRTVEWHLKKVFTKLGVGSRRELDAVLPRQP